jgi:hypothetical protein
VSVARECKVSDEMNILNKKIDLLLATNLKLLSQTEVYTIKTVIFLNSYRRL